MSSVHRAWRTIVALSLTIAGLAAARSDGAQLSFTNTTSIALTETETNALTVGAPYPSTITVSGLTGQVITNLTVTLNGFSHSFPSDASVLLVGPTGQAAVLMSQAGGQDMTPVTNLTLTFDDNSQYQLPILDGLTTGTFQPGAYELPLPFEFPSPAPAGNSNAPAELAVFLNTDPDGVWKLFALDSFAGIDGGSISGGWTLSIGTGVPLGIRPVGTNIVFSWPVVTNQTFNLQTSLNLLNTNGWTNLAGTPVLAGGQYVFTNANSNQLNKIRYFRLIGP